MEKKCFLAYFDLRKYGFIEKNFSEEETMEILTAQHRNIEALMSRCKAELYQIHTDTAVYAIEEGQRGLLSECLRNVKETTDQVMIKKNLPSRLSILCVYDHYFSGLISLQVKTYRNISGPAMNELQNYRALLDSLTDDEELNGGIILSAKAMKECNTPYKQLRKIKDKELYLL